MFKCKDCGEEYDYKPDYCKCGNDLFEEVKPQVKIQVQEKSIIKKQGPKISIERLFSIIFFIICLIIAVIPWTIKEKKTNYKPIKKQEQNINNNIPDIENIWSSSKSTVQKPPAISEPQAVKVIENDKSVQIKQPQTQKHAPEPASIVQKPTHQSVVSSKPQAPVKLPQSITNAAQPKPDTSQMQAPSMSQPEFQKYKGDIRNALAARLNLVNVQGEGECEVEFSVDKQGKLLNRKFIHQSNNKTVNDEVYYMLMRMPSFKVPPENYNGEKIRFKVYLNNNYYEISYI